MQVLCTWFSKTKITLILPFMTQTKPQIEYEDFSKLDIRVGTVLSCEKIEKSQKLLKLEVDFGEFGKRQILAGMTEFYQPEDLVGLQSIFLINLEHRKMMGLESQGMILAVGLGEDKKPLLLKISEETQNGEGVC